MCAYHRPKQNDTDRKVDFHLRLARGIINSDDDPISTLYAQPQTCRGALSTAMLSLDVAKATTSKAERRSFSFLDGINQFSQRPSLLSRRSYSQTVGCKACRIGLRGIAGSYRYSNGRFGHDWSLA